MTYLEKEETIKGIDHLLTEYYLFPKIATSIIAVLHSNFKSGKYDNTTNPKEFSRLITSDLQSINNDLHLKLKYDPEDTIGRLKPKLEHRIKKSKKDNFGFIEVKILKGNVGYLKLNRFENPIFSGDTLTATMNFLCNTDALIIDIMDNPGGNIPMGELMSSYFFNDRVHLNSYEYREYDIVHHTYTAPYVYGQQYLNKDLYILISNNTASLAESFSYELKHLERAVIIGEQSVGAAHSGSHRSIRNFKLYVPNGRSIHPITKSNWEGIGVTPDIKVSKTDALSTAYFVALQKLQLNSKEQLYGEAIKSITLDNDVISKVIDWLNNK